MVRIKISKEMHTLGLAHLKSWRQQERICRYSAADIGSAIDCLFAVQVRAQAEISDDDGLIVGLSTSYSGELQIQFDYAGLFTFEVDPNYGKVLTKDYYAAYVYDGETYDCDRTDNKVLATLNVSREKLEDDCPSLSSALRWHISSLDECNKVLGADGAIHRVSMRYRDAEGIERHLTMVLEDEAEAYLLMRD